MRRHPSVCTSFPHLAVKGVTLVSPAYAVTAVTRYQQEEQDKDNEKHDCPARIPSEASHSLLFPPSRMRLLNDMWKDNRCCGRVNGFVAYRGKRTAALQTP